MAARFFPVPQGLSFRDWATLMAEQLADLGVSAPLEGMKWQEWGQDILNFPELVSFPDTYGFDRWEDWAMRILEVNIN